MPYKRTTKRKTYKKRPYKKTTNRIAVSKVPRGMVNLGLGMPSKMMTKLKYNDTFTMSSAGGFVQTHQFILNGLYDPDYTATGHQPMYFDQFMALYNHYTVVGCKMNVLLVPRESNTVPMTVAVWQNDDIGIVPSTIDNMGEQSKAQSYIIGSVGDTVKSLNLKWSAKKTFGKNVLANNALRGNFGANPTEQSVGVISVQSADDLTTTTCTVKVSLEFITIFSELRDINGS